MLIQFLIIYTSTIYGQSFLNTDEISNLKYGISITDTPIKFDQELGSNLVQVSSIHGQFYKCTLPDKLENDDENTSTDLKLNTVVSLLDKSFNKTCFKLNKGWWSYKFCHKNKIEQYHIEDDGSVKVSTLLGLYESEKDWRNSTKETGSLKARHEQTYVNGTLCALTSKPRDAVVKYMCGETDGQMHFEEPHSCHYIITITSRKLCTHPLFKSKQDKKTVNLVCHPILSEEAYSLYEAKKERKVIKELERKAIEAKNALNNPIATSLQKLMEKMLGKVAGSTFDAFHEFDLLKERTHAKLKRARRLSEDLQQSVEAAQTEAVKVSWNKVAAALRNSVQVLENKISELFEKADTFKYEALIKKKFMEDESLQSFNVKKTPQNDAEFRRMKHKKDMVNLPSGAGRQERIYRELDAQILKQQKVEDEEKLKKQKLEMAENKILEENKKKVVVAKEEKSGSFFDELQSTMKKVTNMIKHSFTGELKELNDDQTEEVDPEMKAKLSEEVKKIKDALEKQLKDSGVKLDKNIKIKVITSKEEMDEVESNNVISATSGGKLDFKNIIMDLMDTGKEKQKEEARQGNLQMNYDNVFTEDEDN